MEGRRLHESPMRPLVLLVDGHDDTLALHAIALSALGSTSAPPTMAPKLFDGRAGCTRTSS
jgi:hypothetical protein